MSVYTVRLANLPGVSKEELKKFISRSVDPKSITKINIISETKTAIIETNDFDEYNKILTLNGIYFKNKKIEVIAQEPMYQIGTFFDRKQSNSSGSTVITPISRKSSSISDFDSYSDMYYMAAAAAAAASPSSAPGLPMAIPPVSAPATSTGKNSITPQSQHMSINSAPSNINPSEFYPQDFMSWNMYPQNHVATMMPYPPFYPTMYPTLYNANMQYSANTNNNVAGFQQMPIEEPVNFQRVFFGNLPYNTNLQAFRDLLEKHGLKGFSIEIPHENYNKGYAIVTFNDALESQKCIELLNFVKFNGRKLTVRYDRYPSFANRNRWNGVFDYFESGQGNNSESPVENKTRHNMSPSAQDTDAARDLVDELAKSLNKV